MNKQLLIGLVGKVVSVRYSGEPVRTGQLQEVNDEVIVLVNREGRQHIIELKAVESVKELEVRD